MTNKMATVKVGFELGMIAETKSETEIIYVLINESMPGYVKIGKTNNLLKRLKDLDQTPVPLPFQCYYAVRAPVAKNLESKLHAVFDSVRARSNREFFKVDPAQVVNVLLVGDFEKVTLPKDSEYVSPEGMKSLREVGQRREKFRFALADILPGSELVFARDPKITATVLDDTKVIFNGKQMALSAAAKEILGKDQELQGPIFWTYEGETLDARRRRIAAQRQEEATADESPEPNINAKELTFPG